MAKGHVHRTKNKQAWAVTFDEPRGDDGKRRQRTKQPFLTKKAAEEFLRDQLGRMDANDYTPPKRITLATFLNDKWLPSLSPTLLRESTLAGYQQTVERHIAPGLGGVQVAKLTADRIDRFYRELERGGHRYGGRPLSAKTVRNIHGTLHVALDAARKWRYISRNPADDATPPKLKSVKARSRSRVVWSPAELNTFLDSVGGDRLAAAWELIATTGFRRGELLGLRWVDLDLDAGIAEVKQTAIQINYRVVISEAKTEAGERRVALDPETVAILKAHKARQNEERLAMGAGWTDSGLVFTREDGRPIQPDRFSSWFQQHARRAGLPRIRLHDVRHSHATAGLLAGVPMKVMSERLGHSTQGITSDLYSHVLEEMDVAAAETIAAVIRNARRADSVG